MGRCVGYLKTLKNTHQMQEQKKTILDFAQREKINLSRFIEIFPIVNLRAFVSLWLATWDSN